MEFYHYNLGYLPDLRSLVNQGLYTSHRRDGSGSMVDRIKGNVNRVKDHLGLLDTWEYSRNLSFFFEPMPRNIASLYNHQHALYKKGLKLFEYRLFLSNLPDPCDYRVVETPEKNALLYEKQNWDLVEKDADGNYIPTDPLYQKYMAELKYLEEVKFKFYRGNRQKDMVKAIEHIKRQAPKGKCNEFFINKAIAYAKTEEDREGLYFRYAQAVPHLMLYPGVKTIHYADYREIILK